MKSRLALSALIVSTTMALSPHLMAGETDLSNQPLASTEISAKPNLLFIMDNSGSMANSFMPESVSLLQNNEYGRARGWDSYQCNGLAYNPSTVYTPPKTPTGATYPALPASASRNDGFNPSQSSRVTSTVTHNMGLGSKTFPLTSASGFTNGMVVLVISHTDVSVGGSTARWMQGTVTNVKTTSPASITVDVTFSTNDSSISYSGWRVGPPSTVNVTGFSYYRYTGTQPRLGWTYNSSGSVVQNTFFNECNQTSNGSVFSTVTVSDLTADEQTNYGNWYAYYRKRILTMRSSAGFAFSGLDDDYRVGYSNISDPSVVTGTNHFLAIGDFTAQQRANFYRSLYETPASSWTPLRAALSKAGRYYANAAPGQGDNLIDGQSTATPDPVQYSCQRNYTLLSTDGYWNTQDEDEANGFGAFKVDGTTLVGQVDGFEKRPQYDGARVRITKTYRVDGESVVSGQWRSTVTSYPLGNYRERECVGVTKSGKTTYTCTNYETPGNSSSTTVTTRDRTTTKVTQATRTHETLDGLVVKDITSPNTPNVVSTTVVDTNEQVTGTTATTWQATGARRKISSNSCTVSFFNSCSGFLPSTNSTSYAAGPATSTVVVDPTATTLNNVVTAETLTSTVETTEGGAANSLADVAAYYYATPFRVDPSVNCIRTPDNEACRGELSPSGSDLATYQHMTTFTLGLGVSGQMKYDPNYISQTSGDYYNVRTGPNNWPTPYNQSAIDNDIPGKIDDLWHTAVNGRGQYFSGSESATLEDSIKQTLRTINNASGYSGSAAASSLRPVPGTDEAYLASYTTIDWVGDLKAFKLLEVTEDDVLTGVEVSSQELWSAYALLNATTYTSRNIYYKGSVTSGTTSTRALKAFNFTNLTADGLGGQFSNVCSRSPALAQCEDLDDDKLAILNNGTHLVNYLRGDRSNENGVFRARKGVLGDIVNASPVFVGAPPFKYADEGYAEFARNQATRVKTVYIAANDGMLHAISADSTGGGNERWAFIPSAVIPNLHLLADKDYAEKHRYFVDGSPIVGDVADSNGTWRTILVGGLNKGGKAYYALDITNPNSPSLLWEFDTTNDADLGLTYGNPIITKIKVKDEAASTADTTVYKQVWTVMFSSGYNNHTSGGTGVGALYIVDANTGSLIKKIQTTEERNGVDVTVGDTDTPSGLGKINVWVESETDNLARRAYGGPAGQPVALRLQRRDRTQGQVAAAGQAADLHHQKRRDHHQGSADHGAPRAGRDQLRWRQARRGPGGHRPIPGPDRHVGHPDPEHLCHHRPPDQHRLGRCPRQREAGSPDPHHGLRRQNPHHRHARQPGALGHRPGLGDRPAQLEGARGHRHEPAVQHPGRSQRRARRHRLRPHRHVLGLLPERAQRQHRRRSEVRRRADLLGPGHRHHLARPGWRQVDRAGAGQPHGHPHQEAPDRRLGPSGRGASHLLVRADRLKQADRHEEVLAHRSAPGPGHHAARHGPVRGRAVARGRLGRR